MTYLISWHLYTHRPYDRYWIIHRCYANSSSSGKKPKWDHHGWKLVTIYGTYGTSLASVPFRTATLAMTLTKPTVYPILQDGYQSSWRCINTSTTINIFTWSMSKTQITSIFCTNLHLRTQAIGSGKLILKNFIKKQKYTMAWERRIYQQYAIPQKCKNNQEE